MSPPSRYQAGSSPFKPAEVFQTPQVGGQSRSAGFQPVSNLLYRRFPIGRPLNLRAREMVRTTRRLEALRYGRLETGWKPALRLCPWPCRTPPIGRRLGVASCPNTVILAQSLSS